MGAVRVIDRIQDLADVNSAGIVDGDLLRYDATTGKFVRVAQEYLLDRQNHVGTLVSSDISDSTDLNTAETVVRRDGSGGFSAGVVQVSKLGIGIADPSLLYGTDYGLNFQAVGSGGMAVSGPSPHFILNDTLQSENLRLFDIANVSQQFRLRSFDDNSLNVLNLVSVTRAGKVLLGEISPSDARLGVAGGAHFNFAAAADRIHLTGNVPQSTDVHLVDVDVTHTGAGELYGVLSRPKKADGTPGIIIAVEGYLSNSPHAANNTIHYGVVGDVRSAAQGYTGSLNVGVWSIAGAAEKNISFYGSVGDAIFNDRVGIGLYNRESGSQALRVNPVFPSYPFHFLDRSTLSGNETSTAHSFYLEKNKKGAGLYSENGSLLYLRRNVSDVTSENGNFIIASNALTELFRLTKTGGAFFAGAIDVTALENAARGLIKLQGRGTTGTDIAGISFHTPVSPNSANARSWYLVANYSASGNIEFRRSTTAAGSPATTTFALDSSGNANIVNGVLQIAAKKVVGARITGWAAPTGTLKRNAADYSALTDAEVRQVLAALVTDLHATAGHGLLGT